MWWKTLALVGIATTVLAAAGPAPARAQRFTELVRVGDPVPATSRRFGELGVPIIGASREIAFGALFEGARVDVPSEEDEGLFVYQARLDARHVRASVVIEGETLPGATAPVQGVPVFRLSSDGTLALLTTQGLWRWMPGMAAPAAVAVSNTPVPLSSSYEWRLFLELRGTPTGPAIHWHSSVSDTSGGVHDVVAQVGVTETPMLELVTRALPRPSFDSLSTSFRASGTGWSIAATAEVVEPELDRYRVLLRDGSIVLEEGDHGLDGFQAIGIDDARDVLFYGIEGAGAAATRSLWILDGADARRIASAGDVLPLPGAPTLDESNFTSLTRAYLGGGGHVVLKAHLAGATAATDEAIVLLEPDHTTWRLLAREGDPAPGLAGLDFGALERVSFPTNTVAVDRRGDVLVRATLAGAGVVARANDDSLWRYVHAEDRLELILRTGQEVRVEGVPHVLTRFEVQLGTGVQDGHPTAWDDAGNLALLLFYEPIGGGAEIVGGGWAPTGAPIVEIVRPSSEPLDGGVATLDAGVPEGGWPMPDGAAPSEPCDAGADADTTCAIDAGRDAGAAPRLGRTGCSRCSAAGSTDAGAPLTGVAAVAVALLSRRRRRSRCA